MATKKPKATQKKPAATAKGASLKKAAPAKKSAPKAASKKAAPKAGAAPSAKAKAGYAAASRNPLLHEIAEHLGTSEAEAIDQALATFATSLGLRGSPREMPEEKATAGTSDAPQRTASSSIAAGGYLPRRVYLHLDSRGIDGAGMPVEVIDFPCTLGSGRRNTIWINSPQVETVHAQIVESGDGWTFEDLDSQHGTFLNGERISKEPLRDGETFLLAGYVRVKVELK